MSVEGQTFPKSVQPGIPKLGSTPKGWKRYRIGDLFDVVSRPTDLHDDQEYDLVTVKRSRGGIERRSHLLGRQISVKSQFLLEEGDFLISKRQIVHGACAVVPAEFSGSIVSNEYSVLRPRPVLSLYYLRYLVHSIYLQQTFFHSSVGVHVEKMLFRLDDWFKWPIHLPPVPEQGKLGRGLMDADAKITILTDKKTALEDYKRGLMQRLFSRELRFARDDGSAFPDWEARKLGEIAEIVGGGTPESGKPAFWDGDITWFTPSEIKSKYLKDSERHISEAGLKSSSAKMLPVGTLVLSTRATVGEVGIATQPCTTNQGFQSLVIKSPHHNEFWYYWVAANKRELLRRSAGSTFLEIGKSEVSKIPALSPHPDEQRKIAAALSSLDAKIDALSLKISEMDAFKKGLLQKLFV